MSVRRKFIATIAVFFVLSFGVARAATLFLTSDSPQAAVGDTVNVNVRIASDQSVNAAQGVLYYPTDIFGVKQVSRANSIFDIWLPEPSVNTSKGEISFLGGSTNAFSGSSLPVLTVIFEARGTGKGDVGFRNAAVTAGDGTGANILSSPTGMSFAVAAPGTAPAQVAVPQAPPPPKQIVRPAAPAAKVPVVPDVSVGLYPHQDAWYNAVGNFLAQWQLPADVSAVSTALNQNPSFDPTVSEGLFDNKTFGAVTEGMWYVHVRFKNSVGWGPTAHYRIAVDTTPPFAFAAKSKEGLVTGLLSPTLQFSTQDQPSGVASYRILVDGGAVGSSTSTSFTLSPLSFGSHDVVAQAIDYAGNVTESRLSIVITPPATPPFLTIGGIKITEAIFFATIIVVIIIGIVVGWWLGYKAKLQRRNRAIIAGRDVAAAFGVVQKNIEKLLGYYDSGPIGESQLEEIKFLLMETKEETDKAKHYVPENVEEIEQ